MHVPSFLPRNILEIKCPIANFYNVSCRQRIFNGCRYVFHQIARYYYYSSASFPADDKSADAFVHAVVRHYFQCRSCHRQNHSINCPFDWHVLSKRHATLRCFKFQSPIVETPTNVKNGFFFQANIESYKVIQCLKCSVLRRSYVHATSVLYIPLAIQFFQNRILLQSMRKMIFSLVFPASCLRKIKQSIFQNTNMFVLYLINSLLI